MVAQADHFSPAGRFSRPVTDAIWLGPKQQAALVHLCAETPIRVLLGPPSSGKSTILNHVQHHLDDAIVLAVAGPKATAIDVLSTLLTAARLEAGKLSEGEQRNLLHVFINQRGYQGTRVVLCVDNVAELAPPAWKEIEGLARLNIGRKPIAEVILVGTEAEALGSPLGKLLLEGSTSAVEAVRYLSGPSAEDVERYIAWQLDQLGWRNDFSVAACKRIATLAQEQFATINELCDAILRRRGHQGAATIDAGIVRRIASSLAASKQGVGKKKKGPKKRWLQAAASSETDAVAAEPIAAADDATSPERLPDRLIVSRDGKIEKVVRLDKRIMIGRGETNDLLLESATLNRVHAMIQSSAEGCYTVVDLNSTSGVLVNGERVKRRSLHLGDIVGLAQYRLELGAEDSVSH
jgi:hypothetical protein